MFFFLSFFLGGRSQNTRASYDDLERVDSEDIIYDDVVVRPKSNFGFRNEKKRGAKNKLRKKKRIRGCITFIETV